MRREPSRARRSSNAGPPGSGTPSPVPRRSRRSPRPLPGRDLQPPFSAGCAPDLEFHHQRANLAVGVAQPAIRWLLRTRLHRLSATGDELIPPRRQAMRLDPKLAGNDVDVVAAQQTHHRVGLAPDRPTELSFGALLLSHYRHLGPPPAPSS